MKNKKTIYKILFVLIIIILVIGCVNLSKVNSSSDYSLSNSNIELDGEHDGEIEIKLITANGGTFYALDANWGLSEKQGTSYFKLSKLTPASNINSIENDIKTGKVYYVDSSFGGFNVKKGGSIWTAKYKIDKNTPAGTYTIGLNINAITGGTKGYGSDEKIELTANITVKRKNNQNSEISVEKKDSMLNIIGQRVTKDRLIDMLKEENGITIEIKNKNDNQEYIGTGSKITMKKNGTIIEKLDCVVYGDLNGNGLINTGDVISIQRIIAGVNKQTELDLLSGDLSGNKKLDTGDVLRVQRYIAGITKTLEIKK